MAEERSLLSPTASPAIGDISEDNSFLEDWSRARDKTRLRSIIESLHRQATRYWVVLSLAVGAIVLIGASTAWPTAITSSLTAIKSLDVNSLSSYIHKATGSYSKSCRDPWARPGYIWYGKGVHDVRWVPYSYMDTPETPLADPDYASIFNPENSTDPAMEGQLDSEVLDRLPPQLSKAFQSSSRESDPSLEFMRNRHIMILGSSLDQNLVRNFCKMHKQKNAKDKPYYVPDSHRIYCHYPDYNFTLSTIRHFGMHQSPWFAHRANQPGTDIHFEERVKKFAIPLANTYGEPDLLVFSSGLWDFKYLMELRNMHDSQATITTFDILSPERVAWLRSRFTQCVLLMRELFPNAQLLYRTTTRLNGIRAKDDNEMVTIFQQNESAKALMKALGIPVLNWADLVQGNHEYRDLIHYRDDSRPNWLYAEMLLHHLQQVVDPEQDTQCWLDNR